MADLGKAPKMTPYERQMDYLRKEMDRTGADYVSKDGLALSRNNFPVGGLSPASDRRGNGQTPEEAVKRTHQDSMDEYKNDKE